MKALVLLISLSLFHTVIAVSIADPEYEKQLKDIKAKHQERLSELHSKYSGPLNAFEDQIKSEIKELKKTTGTEKEIQNAQRDFDRYKRMADEVYNDRKNEIMKWFKREKVNLKKYWIAIEEQRKEDARLKKLERETREREMKAYEEIQKKNAKAASKRTPQNSKPDEPKSEKSAKINTNRRQRRGNRRDRNRNRSRRSRNKKKHKEE